MSNNSNEHDTESSSEPERDTHENAPYRATVSPPPLSVAHTTPSRRDGYVQLPKTAKERVDSAVSALTQDRCLIEEMSPVGKTVEYAHVLARKSHTTILDRLEFSWRLQRYTLNVHSRYNILLLGVKFHALFDDNNFLLIPSPEVVDAYYRAISSQEKINPKLCRQAGPSMEEEVGKVHDYMLVANSSMIDVPILRRNGPITISPPPPNAYTIMAYPYRELGVLKSHVTPRYIIANAGEKMTTGPSRYVTLLAYNETIARLIAQGAPETLRGIMEKISHIYERWTAAVPADEAFLLSPGVGDNFSDTSKKTAPHRAWSAAGKRTRRSRAPSGDGSPTPSKKSKTGGNNDAVWLDDETLHELDNCHGLSPEKERETKLSSIRQWIDEVVSKTGSEDADSEAVASLVEVKDFGVVEGGIVAISA
ncbi:hypothetical protein Hypma_014795 [Hypsizygus marmoreus]|uniref:HNH nuclease domain-containing protein n=1 Tax=Hypsizygus marmoreus TaxID=39966 RepID=A0A369KDU1_HYPMA|nr:hypothetical protein Hypma_014795 [Hypsizygus marmoreus]